MIALSAVRATDGDCDDEQPLDTSDPIRADGDGPVCIDGLYLAWPSPGLAGMANDLVVLDGSPGALVQVVVASALGSRSIEGCPNALSLDAPVRFDLATVSDVGAAIARRNVPQAVTGDTVYLQAFEPETCRVSNVVAWTF